MAGELRGYWASQGAAAQHEAGSVPRGLEGKGSCLYRISVWSGVGVVDGDDGFVLDYEFESVVLVDGCASWCWPLAAGFAGDGFKSLACGGGADVSGEARYVLVDGVASDFVSADGFVSKVVHCLNNT